MPLVSLGAPANAQHLITAPAKKTQTSSFRMIFKLGLYLLSILVILLNAHAGELVDQNDSCEFWASTGECDNNPDYMLNYCAFSCSKAQKPAYHFESFYGMPLVSLDHSLTCDV